MSHIRVNMKIMLAAVLDYKLLRIEDQFSKSFKSCLAQDGVHTFITNMVTENKYYSNVIKQHFNKELTMIKKDDENVENSTKCWICDNTFVEGDIKVRGNCHVTGKYRDAADKDIY